MKGIQSLYFCNVILSFLVAIFLSPLMWRNKCWISITNAPYSDSVFETINKRTGFRWELKLYFPLAESQTSSSICIYICLISFTFVKDLLPNHRVCTFKYVAYYLKVSHSRHICNCLFRTQFLGMFMFSVSIKFHVLQKCCMFLAMSLLDIAANGAWISSTSQVNASAVLVLVTVNARVKVSVRTHFNLETRWRWVVSFTQRPFYSRVNNPCYSFNIRLGGPQSRSGGSGEEKNVIGNTVFGCPPVK